jgi:hypothetical protein
VKVVCGEIYMLKFYSPISTTHIGCVKKYSKF